MAAPAVTRAEPIQSPVNLTVKFPSPDTDKRKNSNPLVEAGLISESLSSILVPPDGNLSGKTGVRLGKKKSKKARVLKTQEILEEFKMFICDSRPNGVLVRLLDLARYIHRPYTGLMLISFGFATNAENLCFSYIFLPRVTPVPLVHSCPSPLMRVFFVYDEFWSL